MPEQTVAIYYTRTELDYVQIGDELFLRDKQIPGHLIGYASAESRLLILRQRPGWRALLKPEPKVDLVAVVQESPRKKPYITGRIGKFKMSDVEIPKGTNKCKLAKILADFNSRSIVNGSVVYQGD